MHATGPFDVTMNPQLSDDKTPDPTLGRLSLDKQFHGDLEATGHGQMLTAGTAVEGSAGYVAVERVTGSLHGQRQLRAHAHRPAQPRRPAARHHRRARLGYR